jgi:hypothetical protein
VNAISPFRLWALLTGLALPTLALAQYNSPQQQQEEAAAACATCGGCGGCMLFIILGAALLVVLNILLMIWVVRDAKNRGMESPILWLIVILLAGPIAFIIYFFVRPQGTLVPCPHCHNKRMQISAKCPHCGNP